MGNERHHKFGPSTLDALSLCVRFKFNDSCADAGDEGTLLHSAFETGDLSGLDEEQKACVTTVRSYAEAVKFECGMTPADWEDFSEFDVELKDLTFGRTDRILFCEKTGRLHVIDAKFTRVDSAHSKQLQTYGAAFAEMRNSEYPGTVKTVITHVVAPRLGPTDPVEYDASVLVTTVREYIEDLYAKIENPFTPPTPHEDLCARCARAALCPALGKAVKTVSVGTGLPMPEVFAPEAIVSVKDRAIAQVLAGAMENWAEQVKKNNSLFVDGGGEIPGFRRVRRSTGLRVPKERTEEALEALERLGLGASSALGCCSLTVGDVVKQVSEASGIPEAEAKEQVRETLADVAVEGFCSFLSKEKRIADGVLLGKLIAG